jgi:hypothetical protein
MLNTDEYTSCLSMDVLVVVVVVMSDVNAVIAAAEIRSIVKTKSIVNDLIISGL